MEKMINIKIGDDDTALVVDMYLDNYSVNIIERYATDINFTAISGKSMNKYLGDRRELSVNFEPMEDSQINQLFQKIKQYQNDIPIMYKDPQKGQITKRFSCNNLPSATYFISDDGREFWTIPTVVFTETDDSAKLDEINKEGDEYYTYSLRLGGELFTDDEIGDDLSISVSAGSEGLSVGECCASSMSGSLQYKRIVDLRNNSQVSLYINREIIVNGLPKTVEYNSYVFFLESYSVENDTIIHFTAVDAVAFLDNNYPIPPNGTVLSHVQSAAATISAIAGAAITIPQPAFAQTAIEYPASWTVRTLLEYASVYNASNYCALSDTYELKVIDSNSCTTFSEDDYSNLTVGINAPTIRQIRVSQSDMQDPILGEGEKYEDYGIYYLASTSNNNYGSLNLICPWVKEDIKAVGNLRTLIGRSYGTEFSCDMVKVRKLLPPYSWVTFSGYSGSETFYISNANYKFTRLGIFASISGSTKSLSDFEYIGQTETQLKTKVALKMGYQGGFISLEDGIYWDDYAVMENINDG